MGTFLFKSRSAEGLVGEVILMGESDFYRYKLLAVGLDLNLVASVGVSVGVAGVCVGVVAVVAADAVVIVAVACPLCK